MALMLRRRGTSLTSEVYAQFLSRVRSSCTRASKIIDQGNEAVQSESVNNTPIASSNYSNTIHLSPLFPDTRHHSGGYDIEVVNSDTWGVSLGLAQAWKGKEGAMQTGYLTEAEEEPVGGLSSVDDEPDFNEIDNMRVRGNLFYKLDRSSKEFEEYSFDFHRRKKKDDPKDIKKKDEPKETKKKEKMSQNSGNVGPELTKDVKKKFVILSNVESDKSIVGKKKVRTPTFNQLTGPYHEPFCLDIFISNSSVRACIVHRVTSKVVAVAHSISKDIKFDLGSTRNPATCAAVGAILAQRALADDIHDVIYTPRKGDKLEGKLQIVLQSIIDNGINVKVKIKQRRPNRAGRPFMAKDHHLAYKSYRQ